MSKVDERLDFFESERKKLWREIVSVKEIIQNDLPILKDTVQSELNNLKLEVEKRTPDYEKEAAQASKKTSEYRNRSEKANESITKYLEEIEAKLKDIKISAEQIKTIRDEVSNQLIQTQSTNESAYAIFVEIDERKKAIDERITEIEGIYAKYDELIEHNDKLEEIYTKADDTSAKIEQLFKALLSRKKEIDELYYDINGYIEIDEDTKKESVVEGKKQELEKSYLDLQTRLVVLDKDLANHYTTTSNSYSTFSEEKQSEFNSILELWKSDHDKIVKQINELLPNALTAGLSHAYSKKREDEIAECDKLSKTFTKSIWGMVCVSLIPVAVNISLLVSRVELQTVLTDTPRLVLLILPLYLPVLWVAHSSNRKMNLSKRLIEEYTHKEVLSKTYEGLSGQINALANSEVASDLRNKLLYNILEVSSENPGKLISDYNKSDHPLMDALDKSVKLSNAVEKLAKIPGLSKLTTMISRKSELIQQEVMKKANEGFVNVVTKPEADNEG